MSDLREAVGFFFGFLVFALIATGMIIVGTMLLVGALGGSL